MGNKATHDGEGEKIEMTYEYNHEPKEPSKQDCPTTLFLWRDGV